jgi:hypothetical protein
VSSSEKTVFRTPGAIAREVATGIDHPTIVCGPVSSRPDGEGARLWSLTIHTCQNGSWADVLILIDQPLDRAAAETFRIDILRELARSVPRLAVYDFGSETEALFAAERLWPGARIAAAIEAARAQQVTG